MDSANGMKKSCTQPHVRKQDTSSAYLDALFRDEDMWFVELSKSLTLLEDNIWWGRTGNEKKIIADIFRNVLPGYNPEDKWIYRIFLNLVDISTRLSIEEKGIFLQAVKDTAMIKWAWKWLPEWATSWLDPIMDQIKKTLPHYFTS